ncbi:protoglobin domain-containing protein [Planctomycetaceae bacterium SH139]
MQRAPSPPAAALQARLQELRDYVALTPADLHDVRPCWDLLQPHAGKLVEDFYLEIMRHPEARAVFSDMAQVNRLKQSLHAWLADLFAGQDDPDFANRRWQVGYRHVQIGLPSIWVSMAMSRLRDQALTALGQEWPHDQPGLQRANSAISRMMDVDLALIQDAYNNESVSRRLHRERDFAEGVIQTAQAVVMVVDTAGQLIRGNAFLARLLNISDADNEATLPANVCELLASDECEPFLQFIRLAAAGEHPAPLETVLQHQTSAPRRVRWMARPFLPIPLAEDDNQAETGGGVLCVGQDITDLTEAQRQLVRHARLAAIGQTMTGLAHESRNAFQRSQAALETLLLELEDRPAAVQLIERIQRAHDHLLHLYEEVLQFARPVRLELQQLHLDSLVRQTWDHLRDAVSNKQVRLALQADPTDTAITADPFALEQILRNLLENAIEASHSGAELHVTIAPAWLGSQPASRLVVRDFGKGIPEKYRDRLFEPFFTTRSSGTGLGLPIARRLAEGHGGSLDLNAAEPGTIAILTLPLVAIPEMEPGPSNEDTRRSE